MAINKEQIKELLGSGLAPGVVASAVGCDHSYISQLLGDEVFAGEVATLRTISLTADTKRDSSIDAIEDKLLAKLDEVVTDGAFYKPRDLLSAVAVVNKLQRRGKPIGSGAGPATVNNIVNIQLPAHVSKKFVTNRTNEVIEVEGQTLVTMPAHQLLRDLAEKSRREEAATATPPPEGELEIVIQGAPNRYGQALNYLPSGISSRTVRDE